MAQDQSYGGFWVRVVALTLDNAVVFLLLLAAVMGLAALAAMTGLDTLVSLLSWLIVSFVPFLYWPVLESSGWQATVGKRIMGLQVSDTSGGRLSFLHALMRMLAKIVSAIPFGLGFALAAFTARKQALHDLIAGTLVVHSGPSRLWKIILVLIVGFLLMVASAAGLFYYAVTPMFKKTFGDKVLEARTQAPVRGGGRTSGIMRPSGFLVVPTMRIRAFLAAAVLSFPVAAQNYPTKPLRLIVPFTPAGAVDIASRAIANEMSKTLGQPVTVENRPGAGGNLGAEAAARSAPDGYTLFMSTSGIQAINPALYANMTFDPNRELVSVAPLVSLNNVLVLHPSVKANSVKEVIALAKAQPGKIPYASSGNGTSIHMSGVMFTYLTGTDMIHIPYKGSAPAVTDLLAGQVSMMFDNIPSALPHIKSGKLKALATSGAKRDPALPDLPTIAEAGVPGYESGVWFGLMVPAGTPKDIIARLNAEAVKGAKSAEFVKRMGDLGYNIIPGTPEHMTEMIKAEIARWTPIIRSTGAKVD